MLSCVMVCVWVLKVCLVSLCCNLLVCTAAATAALLLLTTVSQLLKASVTNTIFATPLKINIKVCKIGIIKAPGSIPILLKEV